MTIDEQNMASVMLMQALLGAISPNFKRIAASFSKDSWKIGFWLEREDGNDREEIDDVLGELDALIAEMRSPPSKIVSVTEICGGPLPSLDPTDWRIIFLRRE